METLQNLAFSSESGIIVAFLLGIITAISPCPMATNIAAIGFISKDIENRKRIFWNGILYTVGRIVTYGVLGIILISILKKGGEVFDIQFFLSTYGGKILSPVLIIFGLFLLFIKKINLPKFGFSGNAEKVKSKGAWGAFVLGVLFSLAFCPSSAVFFFGMLVPMAALETWHAASLLMPIIFAIATGLPVIIMGWFLAFSFQSLGKFYNKMQVFERWLRIGVGVVFVGIGVYYGVIVY